MPQLKKGGRRPPMGKLDARKRTASYGGADSPHLLGPKARTAPAVRRAGLQSKVKI